jgi:hypothetical protein
LNSRAITDWKLISVLVAAIVLIGGCESMQRTGKPPRSGTEIQTNAVELRDDITDISCRWKDPIWVGMAEQVKGFRVSAFFISAETRRGAFVSGDILVNLFLLERGADGDVHRGLIYNWELDPQKAADFRHTRTVVGGYMYGLILAWPDEFDLHGQHIEIQIQYRRGDGQIISYPPKHYRVPDKVTYRV